jgi:hypothetical protein
MDDGRLLDLRWLMKEAIFYRLMAGQQDTGPYQFDHLTSHQKSKIM